MSIRVYVPSTPTRLKAIVAADGVGPAPFLAHAVTDGLRAALADAGDEDWEYAASTTAAQSSLALLTDAEPARRVVLALDVAQVRPVGGDDVTLVEVDQPAPFRRIAAVLADDDGADAAVAAAREAWAQAEAEAPDAVELVERCLDHDLGWYATQEIGDLLVSLGEL